MNNMQETIDKASSVVIDGQTVKDRVSGGTFTINETSGTFDAETGLNLDELGLRLIDNKLTDPDTGEVFELPENNDLTLDLASKVVYWIFSQTNAVAGLKARKKDIDQKIKARTARIEKLKDAWSDFLVKIVDKTLAETKSKAVMIQTDWGKIGKANVPATVEILDNDKALAWADEKGVLIDHTVTELITAPALENFIEVDIAPSPQLTFPDWLKVTVEITDMEKAVEWFRSGPSMGTTLERHETKAINEPALLSVLGGMEPDAVPDFIKYTKPTEKAKIFLAKTKKDVKE